MKIMHTSDWHLGKKIEGRDRLCEQKNALEEICQYAENKHVDIVLICGDIFDTYTPSADAEDLFYESVTRLCNGGNRLVIVIAGNHDDPVRLCAASALAQRNAIIISGGGDELFSFPGHCTVKLTDSGKGFVKVKINSEEAVVNFLGFPSDSRLGEIAGDISYSDKIAGYLQNGNNKFLDNTINITLSHLFVAGAQPVGEEREIQAGGVKACSLKVFSDKCHYTALGHIHRHQKLADNIFYSGSLLQYSVDESCEKSVLVFDIDCKIGMQNFEKLPIISGKKIICYTAESFIEALEFLKVCNDYVYLKIRQNKPLLYEESKSLKSYENLLNIELEITGQKIMQDVEVKKHYSKRELFTAYYIQKYNSTPSNDLVSLFLEIIDN